MIELITDIRGIFGSLKSTETFAVEDRPAHPALGGIFGSLKSTETWPPSLAEPVVTLGGIFGSLKSTETDARRNDAPRAVSLRNFRLAEEH